MSADNRHYLHYGKDVTFVTPPPAVERPLSAPQHVHTNPSPSHEVGAWCNGAGYDAPEHLRGCGQCVPLTAFADGPHESYLQDVRFNENQEAWWRRKVEALEKSLRDAEKGRDQQERFKWKANERVEALEKENAALKEETVPTKADLLDLLAKLASGYGGRRTGMLKHLGWLTWTVTEEGLKALTAYQDTPEG